MKNFFVLFFLIPLFCFSQNRLLAKSNRDNTVPYFTSNLPIVKIWVTGNASPTTTNQNATMEIVGMTGSDNRSIKKETKFSSRIKIKLRGTSSNIPSVTKKQYAISMLNDAGAGLAKSLFGFPEDEDWVLQSNFFDLSQLRNSMTYQLVREMGYYSPRTVNVELILNGQYWGTHAIIEKITRNVGRVNVPTTSTGSPNGGYIFKKDHLDDPTDSVWYSSVDANTNFVTTYPKASNFSAPIKTFIKTFTDSFETLLKSTSFDDTTIGWVTMGDRQAFADWILFNELCKSVDFYCYSVYFNKTTNGKLFPFPAWDSDWTFGDIEIDSSSSPNFWWFNAGRVGSEGLFWPKKMMQGTNFFSFVKTRWAQLRQTTFSQERIFAIIDSNATELSARAAITRNFIKWPLLNQDFGVINYYGIPFTYRQEILNMKAWLTLRLAWLDNQLQ